MSEKVSKGKLAVDASKNKSKDKVKEKDKNALAVEWDSNSSSSNCILCKTIFGRIVNRRHHCRNCGRLVCESCSTHRFKLTEGSTEPPQRVCDICNDILRQKLEMKIQVVQLKDKNLELMLSTSMISDSLINLFYLDGSTKTIGIDETTTISELATLACSFMSIALFEVVQNIQSASQYKMLLPNQNVVALIDQWQTTGQPYIKIVMPINNPHHINFNASDDQFSSRESFATTNSNLTGTTGHTGTTGRESVMHRSSMLGATPMALPPTTHSAHTPSPMKSIYKIKASPHVTSPIYLASSADLMGTSLDSHGRSSPPTSPRSPTRKNSTANNNNTTTNTNNTTTNHHGSVLESSSRNSSFSDAPSGTDTHKSNSTSQIINMRDPAAMLVNSQVMVHTLQAEVTELKAQLKKAQQKYDILQAVCFKSGQLDQTKLQYIDALQHQQSLPPPPANTSTTATSSASTLLPTFGSISLGSGSAGNTNSSAGTSSVGSGVPVERKVSKRSSFSWGSKSTTNTTPTNNTSTNNTAPTNANNTSSNTNNTSNNNIEDEASEKDFSPHTTTFSLSRNNNTNNNSKPIGVRSSISGNNAGYSSEVYNTYHNNYTNNANNTNNINASGNRNRTSTAGTFETDDPPSRNNTTNNTPNKDNDNSSESESVVQSVQGGGTSGTITHKNGQETKSVQIMNDVLQDPTKILSLNRAALNLLVRTFFCKVGEIEGFCNKYCRLFDSVLHTDIVTVHSGQGVYADDGVDKTLYNEEGSDPKLITHIYHMIAAMDGVYEFLVEYHEDWRAGLKTWLLRTFDECVQLPVVRTDDLKSTIYCLQRENLILSPEVLDIIQGSIDTSMHRKTPHVVNYKYKYLGGDGSSTSGNSGSGNSSGGGGGGGGNDSYGRNTESVYVVSTSSGGYNSVVFVQTLQNIIATYYAVIGDLLPTLPVEIDVFAVFQMKLTTIMKNYVRATFYTHKQIMGAPELIQMVSFYDKLATFCEKFNKTTSPVIVKNVTDMRPDVLRQCNTALVASLAEQMLKLFNQDEPAMSAEVDLTEKRSNSPDVMRMLSADSTAHSAAEGDNDLSPGGSSIFRCSTQWPTRLVQLLRQHLSWIPAVTDQQKKVYWCVLLLDTLQEFHVKQTNWLTQSLKANTMTVGPLCKYVNNHTKFALLLTDCIDEWGAELSEKYASGLYDKSDFTVNLFVENSSTGVEGIAQLLYAEMKEILKSSLFRSGWDDSVKCVLLLKSTLHRHFTFLQQHLCSGVGSAGDTGTGGLEAVQQLLIYICECIVSIYIELLLTNTMIQMNLNTISRLSEDLELLTKLFDELRNKIYLSRMTLGARAPHIIETPVKVVHKRGILNFNKPNLKKTGAGGKHNTNNTNNTNTNITAPPKPTTEEELSAALISTEEESKSTFRTILQPLTHLVLAVQMNNQYLPDFVKTELYGDFGAASLGIWQLIMHWRKESKEDILAAYEKLYGEWDPEELEPQVDISGYMGKVKAANLVK